MKKEVNLHLVYKWNSNFQRKKQGFPDTTIQEMEEAYLAIYFGDLAKSTLDKDIGILNNRRKNA